jgi:hypothetical protein
MPETSMSCSLITVCPWSRRRRELYAGVGERLVGVHKGLKKTGCVVTPKATSRPFGQEVANIFAHKIIQD